MLARRRGECVDADTAGDGLAVARDSGRRIRGDDVDAPTAGDRNTSPAEDVDPVVTRRSVDRGCERRRRNEQRERRERT